MTKVLILSGFGINCEEETKAAWNLVGAESEIVHLQDVLQGKCDILNYNILTLPGGFSYGDELGSGKVLGNIIKHAILPSQRSLYQNLKDFLARGGFILGICNGFQALVQSGFLPDTQGKQIPEATLTFNTCGHFTNNWVQLITNPLAKIPLWPNTEEIYLPVRHGEGKLLFASAQIKQAVIDQNLACLYYADKTRKSTAEYPANPNGSELNCAALLHPSGQILGLMPHPEGYLSFFNSPFWPKQHANKQTSTKDSEGQGLELFHNILEHNRSFSRAKTYFST